MDACIEVHPKYNILLRKEETNIVTFTQALRNETKVQEIKNNKIIYDSIKQTLTFENDKAFPIKCLIMGCSIKGEGALGKFGEGMKLSMVIFLAAGLKIQIESGDIQYFPTVKEWGKNHNPLFLGKYDKDVLYVDIRSKTFEDKTKVTIRNVKPSMFEEFTYVSLALLSPSKFEKLKVGPNTLIFPRDQKLIGKVYHKGVRLELRHSKDNPPFLYYSYDFDQISVGRERDCVKSVQELYRLQSQTHFNTLMKMNDTVFLKDNPVFQKLFRQHAENVFKLLNSTAVILGSQVNFLDECIGSKQQNKQAADLIYNQFKTSFNVPNHELLFPNNPMVSLNISNTIKKYELQPKFYPSKDVTYASWKSLIKSNFYITIEQKMEREIFNTFIRQLTEEESTLINKIKDKVRNVTTKINKYIFKVKECDKITCTKDKKQINLLYLSPKFMQEAKQEDITQLICKIVLS